MKPRPTIPDLDHFRARVIQDALTDVDAVQWLRRAVAFEHARPQPGDFTGRATADELATQDARLARIAEACRARASLHRPGWWAS